jgi:hypothetical protein
LFKKIKPSPYVAHTPASMYSHRRIPSPVITQSSNYSQPQIPQPATTTIIQPYPSQVVAYSDKNTKYAKFSIRPQ